MPWSTARRSARLSAGAGARPQEAGARAPSPVRSRGDRRLEAAETAGVAAGWTNRCRELVDAPANEMTPAALASAAEEIADTSPSLSYTELDEEDIEAAGLAPSRPWPAAARLRLGLSSSGTSRRARRSTTSSSASSARRVAVRLGGLAEAAGSHGGHEVGHGGRGSGDCSHGRDRGARALVPCLAVIAACENMPAGDAVRPGDIVRGLNGTTVEITNTDAEGRLILADALVYARNLGATHLIDLATLTGGIVVAMGDVYAALRQRRRSAGAAPDRREASGDRSGRGRCTRARPVHRVPLRRRQELVSPAPGHPGVRGSVPAAVRGGRRLGARGHGRNGLPRTRPGRLLPLPRRHRVRRSARYGAVRGLAE